MKRKIFGALVLIILVGITIIIAIQSKITTSPKQAACTQEAKLCSDGSYVGRTGLQCEFSACPEAIVATTTKPIPASSGISGTVLLGPTCPVMRNPPDPQCADKPYSVALEVTTINGSNIIANLFSDSQGKFKVNIAPGEYTIKSVNKSSPYPRCSSNGNVSVRKNVFTEIIVSCDTGIR